MDPIPARIGRYVVESLVGAGGMGQIYKAHDPDIRRTVAIKLISTRLMSGADSAEYIRRFRREAEAAARCAHPNIIAIYDYALHEGEPFLAMEFVYGMSLRQILDEKGAMPAADAIPIMLQVLDALASAHEQGVIHQDVKPANIMLTPQLRAKVADFGISRFANTDVTNVSSSMGTPNYMSPEQCLGGAVDARSDLFAAGATLFEMVAGERTFPGRSTAEVTNRILNERVPLLPPAVRSAAPRLQFALERAMGKHPEDRFQSALEMADALRQIQGSVRSDAAEDSTRLSAATPASADSPPVAPPTALADAATLLALAQKLAGYVGPIARVLVRNAAAKAGSLEALCSELAAAVPAGNERERFRREVAELARTRPAAVDPTPSRGRSGQSASDQPISEQELERAERALMSYTGPVARILVRRAARETTSLDRLWQALASHIEAPAERAAFLAQKDRRS
jgi:eukaryotic-like serine/threonine-protein kinase